MRTRLPALAVAAVALTAGCATSSTPNRAAFAEPVSSASGGTPAAELRLGYFPNITHATVTITSRRKGNSAYSNPWVCPLKVV